MLSRVLKPVILVGALLALAGCVVAPAPGPYAYAPGYYAPGYYYGPPASFNLGFGWGGGWHGGYRGWR